MNQSKPACRNCLSTLKTRAKDNPCLPHKCSLNDYFQRNKLLDCNWEFKHNSIEIISSNDLPPSGVILIANRYCIMRPEDVDKLKEEINDDSPNTDESLPAL